MNTIRHIIYTAMAILAVALPLSAGAQSPSPLITSTSQVEGIALSYDNIAINSQNPEVSVAVPSSFTVNLPIQLSGKDAAGEKKQGLVVYMGRKTKDGAPTAIKVEGHVPGTLDGSFTTIGYAYLLYRGEGTNEFSNLIFAPGTHYDKLRFTIERVASGKTAKFSKFNLFKIAEGDPYPAGRSNPVHTPNDYFTGFEAYTYAPNKGILEPRNQYGDNGTYYGGITETPWKDSIFVHDREEHELPTFKKQGDGQMPHVMETTLYAMPGDVISLSPFYSMPEITQYKEGFSHWYGYNPKKQGKLQPQDYHHITDSAGNRLLDFLIDPAGIVYTDSAGYLAGEKFPRYSPITITLKDANNQDVEYCVIYNFTTLSDFAERVNAGETGLNAILARDVECDGGYITIGTDRHPYCGTFNGNAHAIKNFYINAGSSSSGYGLFAALGRGATIKNLQVLKGEVITGGDAGLLVGRVYGTAGTDSVIIENVLVQGRVQYTYRAETPSELCTAGGIIGCVENTESPIVVKLDHVVFTGNVRDGKNYGEGPIKEINNAGLIGNLNGNKAVLNNCYVDANVSNHNSSSDEKKAIGKYTSAAEIEGVDGSSINVYYWSTEASINIDNAYLHRTENDHRIIVPAKSVPDGWEPLRMIIRDRGGWGIANGWTDPGQEMSKSYGFYHIALDKYKDAGQSENAWEKLINGPSINWRFSFNSNGQHTELFNQYFKLIPNGYKDILFYNISPGSSPVSLPIPDMKRIDVSLDGYILSPDLRMSHPLRWYGTEATFYQPLKTKYAPTDTLNLSLEKPAYHIAADFSHEFNSEGNDYNLDRDSAKVHDPVIAFRHIFHIYDGKAFADSYTDSTQHNINYIQNNARAVSARADQDFQIRLSTQIPVYNAELQVPVKTNFYYKKKDGTYDRVPRVGIVEINAEGNEVGTNFFFDGRVSTQGWRDNYPDSRDGFSSGSSRYYTGNGGGEVYRTLFCKAADATAGKHKVRLVALNADGTNIKTADEGGNLYLAEYEVTFLPSTEASVITEDVYKEAEASADHEYYTHTKSYLQKEDVCGDKAAVVVDFDQYRHFEEGFDLSDYFITKGQPRESVGPHRYWQWPMLWQKSTYSFGYGGYYNYDYNEYIIANHSDQVMYNSAVTPGDYPFPHEGHINPDGSTGLYDRLWYDTYNAGTNTGTLGYFYYVNAASDPGVAAKLMIHDLCPGSTINVSAWIAELSLANEVANLCFNFVAVDSVGNREIVHSFVTGYIDDISYGSSDARHANKDNEKLKQNHGKWMHIYYSFIPDLNNIGVLDHIDHYELELENNCVSSNGADYAVDDIRAYIVAPKINARQLEPVCDANQKTLDILISSRFDKLLESNGLVENEGKDLDLYFAVLDKKKYDKNRDVNAAKIQMTKPDGSRSNYIKVTISDNYNSNVYADYNPDTTIVLNKPWRYTSPSKIKHILINIRPHDDNLRADQEYYIVLFSGRDPGDDMECFAITGNPCEKFGTLSVQGSSIVKIDGVAYTDGDAVLVCAGQAPVVQVKLQMKKAEDGQDINEEYKDYLSAGDHCYDWYQGTLDDFMAKRSDGGPSYYTSLSTYRLDHPETETISQADIDAYSTLRLDSLVPLIESGKLQLHQSSYVFRTLVNKGDTIPLTAMPILSVEEKEDTLICSQPNEIRIVVKDDSPVMYDGFKEINYGLKEDVPLRLGYKQLKTVAGLGGITYRNTGADTLAVRKQIELTIPDNARKLEIPLRGIQSYLGPDTLATMTILGNKNFDADPFVYLLATNDSAYIGLNKHPSDRVALKFGLLPVGKIADMEANTNPTNRNVVTVVFSEQMEFSEGYYYTMRFAFDEHLENEVAGYCQGHVVFTVKVVPEYMKWTGAASRNWNNDDNWERMTYDSLMMAKIDPIHTIAPRKMYDLRKGDTVTLPPRIKGYAPLNFTKTVVPNITSNNKMIGYPVMFDAPKNSLTTVTYGALPWNYKGVPQDSEDAELKDLIGAATDSIEFDMVGIANDDNNMLECHPWYANTCQEIHFRPGSEILYQQHFIFGQNYKRAWVDVEMASNQWHLLGSPLKRTVAGDMYTVPGIFKQNTELFKDISFNPDVNDRHKAAVYQRGWNKATTNTYYLGIEKPLPSAVVKLNWSRVYNDVEEDYSPGIGFSVRAVTPENGQLVQFRLPKADDSYMYYTSDYNKETGKGTGHNTDIERGEGDERHSLIDFSGESDNYLQAVNVGGDEGGYFFLVANPLMAHMNMETFFNENGDLSNTYWIMNEDRQAAVCWDEKTGTYMSTSTDGEGETGLMAPMQGFFVKANTKANTLNLKFTPAMIADKQSATTLAAASRSGWEPQLIRVTAIDSEGRLASSAIINIDADAQAAYDGSEDAPLLIDHSLASNPTVYSVASGQALAINRLDAITETEIGLHCDENSSATLLFEGVDEIGDLLLLDTATGEFTEMYDGMTVDVKGPAAGRFYITRRADSLTEPTLAIVCKDRTISVVSSTDGIAVRIYTPTGMYMGQWSTEDSMLEIDIEPGIFLVEAVSGDQRATRKFIVK